MLGAMLGAHSQCVSPPECTYKFDLLNQPRSGDSPPQLMSLLRSVMGTKSFRNWEIDLDPDQAPLDQMAGSCRALLEWIVTQYAMKLNKSDVRYWIDHTPPNFRFMPLLLETFPDLKAIHLVRDGRAVAASVIPMDWGPNSTPRAAIWWVESICFGMAAETTLPAQRIARVRYEDIVREPVATIGRLCRFIGIEPEPQMTAEAGYRTPSHLRGTHALVGKRPNADRINVWEKVLTPRQIELFEAYSGQMLAMLKYDMKFGSRARRMDRSERISAFIREFWSSFVGNPIRHRRRLKKVKGAGRGRR
jgi:hypothetical protein